MGEKENATILKNQIININEELSKLNIKLDEINLILEDAILVDDTLSNDDFHYIKEKITNIIKENSEEVIPALISKQN